MTRPALSLFAALSIACLVGCGHGDANAQSAGGEKPADLVKLSQFGQAGSCAIAVGADGTIHALFADAKSYGKPAFLYYRASKDDGATWGEAKTISDDESVNSAGYCRAIVDGKGRLFAIWKYVSPNELLEGPNGPAAGVLCVRVMENGAWSKPREFGSAQQPMTSWYAAVDPKGVVHVVYSRADEGTDYSRGGMMSYFANNTDQLTFAGGANEPTVTRLVTGRPVKTLEQATAEANAKSAPIAYDDTRPAQAGMWNLNGYVDDDGRPRFLAERQAEGQQFPAILRFDGAAVQTFVDYKMQYLSYNSFNNPPVLLRAGDGKEHVIRKPEVGENEVLRDYVVDADGKPSGDKTDVIAPASPKAKIGGWWASPLAGGRIAAMAAVNPNADVWDATDLLLSVSDGRGGWSTPANVTQNKARETFAARNGVSQSTSYRPTYAAAATLKDGSVGVVLLNNDKTISGLNTVGITAGGQAVTGMSTFSSESPYVSFVKVKG